MAVNSGYMSPVRGDSGRKSRSRSPLNMDFKQRSFSNNQDFNRGRKGARRGRTESSDSRRQSMGASVKRVFVANIPFECRWMDLKDLFREKVGDVSFVELFEDDSGKFKGCGVVEFKDAATAQKAIEMMHQYEFRGRKLIVKEDFDTDRGRSGRVPPHSAIARSVDRDIHPLGGDFGRGGFSGNNFGAANPQYNTFGLNPEFLKSLGIVGPLSNRIFVSNLDYKVTEKKLEDIFKISGKVLKVELKVDKEGKSKGHGTVEFDHPLESVQAISMFNGQRLYSRIMNVRVDKFSEESEGIPSKLPSGLHGIGKGLGAGGQPMQFFKNATTLTGSGGGGIGLSVGGNAGSALPSGMGAGSSNIGMMANANLSMGSGNPMGINNTITPDRILNASALAMGMTGNNMGVSNTNVGMGLGGSSGMMTASNMAHTSLDSVGRDSAFQMGTSSAPARGLREGYDRSNDSFNTSYVSDTILLGNLSSTFNWQSLRDRFRDIGDVCYAEPKGQGAAIVRFSSVQEAQRAVDLMNGVRIDGRLIQVRLY